MNIKIIALLILLLSSITANASITDDFVVGNSATYDVTQVTVDLQDQVTTEKWDL